ncbi:hypothetical protein BT96DRAFT_1027676 [Gymnopus androsaceus JB14]|uniref:Uncharacterized protein n=1 Tax=Gymnopus androsaceus JB14 TaxID=1447944 RepID=A0A6A4GA72_9AGAR|nr:hypothetical protein BT96DRAFT_1027676 [Gymnopus androsaceus JB14]
MTHFLKIKQEVETDTRRDDIEMQGFLHSNKLFSRPGDSDSCCVHVPEPAFLSRDRV